MVEVAVIMGARAGAGAGRCGGAAALGAPGGGGGGPPAGRGGAIGAKVVGLLTVGGGAEGVFVAIGGGGRFMLADVDPVVAIFN